MKRKPYPHYKDSGVEWLDAVPQYWEVKRLRFVVSFNPSKQEISEFDKDEHVSFLPMNAVGDDGSLNLEQTKPIKEVENGFTFFRDGDVGIAKITPCFENGKGALMIGLKNGFGFGTTELTILRPSPQIDPKFLFYLTFCNITRKQGEAQMFGSGGQKRVPDDFYRNFRMGIPSVEEQKQIADFLDLETARIDELIAKQKCMIELLAEKRSALISHAVTRGLNSRVTLKDSGVEWLGKVPQHWEVRKLKSASFFQEGPGLRNWQFTVEGTRVICVTNITEAGIDFSQYQKFISVAEFKKFYKHFKVKYGDLLISSSGNSWGKVAEYKSHEEVMLNTSTIRMNENRDGIVCKSILKWIIQSQFVRDQLFVLMTGSCQPNFGPSHLAVTQIVVPPLEEQKQIAEYLDEQTAKIDALTAKAQEAIALMKEHRSSLIAAAVTGKIDVRGQ